MKNKFWKLFSLFLTAISLFLFSSASYSYIGPGAGLSAFGALLALVATVAVAILGFIWYPLKRMIRKRKQVAAKKDGNVDEG
jgi:hypothetical protein